MDANTIGWGFLCSLPRTPHRRCLDSDAANHLQAATLATHPRQPLPAARPQGVASRYLTYTPQWRPGDASHATKALHYPHKAFSLLFRLCAIRIFSKHFMRIEGLKLEVILLMYRSGVALKP